MSSLAELLSSLNSDGLRNKGLQLPVSCLPLRLLYNGTDSCTMQKYIWHLFFSIFMILPLFQIRCSYQWYQSSRLQILVIMTCSNVTNLSQYLLSRHFFSFLQPSLSATIVFISITV